MATKLEKIAAFNKQAEERRAGRPSTDPITAPAPPPITNKEVIAEKARIKSAQELEQERVEAEEAARQKQIDVLGQLTDATANLVDGVGNKVNPVKDWIAAQPTPGGITALLIFIGLFTLAAVPVNAQGETRLHLLYQSIIGRTHLLYRETINAGGNNPNFGAGAGGSFGPPTTTQAPVQSQSSNGSAPVIDITHLNLFGPNA